MKKFLLIAAGLAFLAGVTSGQEYKSRQPYPSEQARIAGITSYVQDELLRSKTPKFCDLHATTNGTLGAYNDGIIIARALSNNTAVVSVPGRIVLPNPTNNINRRFEIIAGAGFVTLSLTNGIGANGFTIFNVNGNTNGIFMSIPTNQLAVVYSTGTNWIGYIR